MSKNTNISELINYLSYDGSGNIVFTTVSAAATNTDKFLVSDTGVLKFRTAAQLLSDIGAQASGSYQAALSGTGFVKISGSTISYDNSTYATETYVGTAISNLVASSPATLDTLNELALALGSDPNFATTVATSIGTKQPQLSGTGFVKISGTTISYDNSTYLTTASASSTYLPLAGGTLTGALGGTSATFSSTVSATQYTATSTGGSGLRVYGSAGTNQWDIYLNSTNLRFSDNTGTGSVVFDRPLSGTSATFSDNVTVSSASTKGFVVNSTNGASFRGFTIQNNGTTQGGIEILPNTGEIRIGGYSTTGDYYPVIYSDGVAALTFGIGASPSATFSSSVGINGATPVAELQVGRASDVTIAMSNSSSVTSGNRGSLAWYNSSVSTVANIRAVAVTDNVGTELQFYTRPAAGSLTQVFTIASTGAATFSSSVTATGVTVTGQTDLCFVNATTTMRIARSGSVARFQNYDNGSAANIALNWEGGNVGIGTSSPTEALDVVGSVNIRKTTAPQLLFFESNSGYTEGMRLLRSNDKLHLTYGWNADEEALTVVGTGTTTGFVGIGTVSPSTRLNVSHPNHGIGISYMGGSALPSIAGLFTDSSSGQQGYGSLLIKSRTDYSGYSINFYTAGTANVIESRMMITSVGNIGVNCVPDYRLDVNGVAQIRDTLSVTKQVGKFYAQTSASGTTSFVNTGIFYNTSITGFGNNGTYFLTVTGNPNGAGSSEYRAVLVGYIIVTTGYDFGISSVVQNIFYTETLNRQALNISTLSVSVVFWNGSTESTQQVHGTTNNQIRIKITGYNSGNIGAAQDVRITKVID